MKAITWHPPVRTANGIRRAFDKSCQCYERRSNLFNGFISVVNGIYNAICSTRINIIIYFEEWPLSIIMSHRKERNHFFILSQAWTRLAYFQVAFFTPEWKDYHALMLCIHSPYGAASIKDIGKRHSTSRYCCAAWFRYILYTTKVGRVRPVLASFRIVLFFCFHIHVCYNALPLG